MKNNILRSIARVVPVVLLGLSTFSCQDMLDIKPETALDVDQNYQNIFDADAAVIGVYGKFLNLAERHVVLNELRADLLNVTANAAAHPDLMQLNYHTVTTENRYADPRPFYEVILNCNDILHNFKIMRAENKITGEQFNQRYSDIVALRSWVYLQLGIHFGKVPFITAPLANVKDLSDITKFDMAAVMDDNRTVEVEFQTLLDSLIAVTEKIPTREPYPAGSSLVLNIDTYNTQKFFVNKRMVLGDLHLWKNNYTKAAEYYRGIMETGSTDTGTGARYYDQYRVGWSNSFNPLDGFNGTQNTVWNYEWIWDMPFSPNFSPTNPFIKLFANVGGNYLLKPSQAAIDLWGSETRTDLTPGDIRGVRAVQMRMGQPVVGKYLQNFNAQLPFENKGNWFLARASMIHLRFAEAANRDGRHELAQAFIQKGIQGTFTLPGTVKSSDDVTNQMQHIDQEKPVYTFDAREGEFPRFRSPWYRHVGTRTRAGLQDIIFDDPFAEQPLMIRIENALVDEAARELAFEGHRWEDLLRIALRRNDDPAFLADKVANKLVKANDPRAEEVRARLMNKANWYLPFRME